MAAARSLRVLEDDRPPRTRGECADVPRPCPHRACRYHNEAMTPELSCALDVADSGGVPLEVVSEAMNITRERVRQIEAKALELLQKRSERHPDVAAFAEYQDEGNATGRRRSPVVRTRTELLGRAAGRPADDDEESDEEPAARWPSFFEYVPDDTRPLDDPSWDAILEGEQRIADRIWTMFARDSTQRGFDARSIHSRRVSRWRANLTPAQRQAQHPNPFKAASAPPPPVSTPEPDPMPKPAESPTVSSDLHDTDRVVLERTRAGDTVTQIAAHAGIAPAHVYNVRSRLRKRGLLGDDRSPPSRRESAAEPPPASSRRARPALEPAPPASETAAKVPPPRRTCAAAGDERRGGGRASCRARDARAPSAAHARRDRAPRGNVSGS